MTSRHLQIVVCGAGPASDVGRLISAAQAEAWTTSVVATKAALGFFDARQIQDLTGFEVRFEYRSSGRQGRTVPQVDALIVAPATFNTVNKLALGIADTYALTVSAELVGRGVPTVVVPFVNSALAGRAPFARSVSALRDEGVYVTTGAQYGWAPHPPGTGLERQAAFPWQTALELATRLAEARSGSPRPDQL